MAMFDTSGLDELIADMRRMGEYSGAVADAMILAGAEEVRKAWAKTAEDRHLRKTGQMIKSIGYSRDIKNIGGIKYTDIYPQGKDSFGRKKPVRNATKAFILHYGSGTWKGAASGRSIGWVDQANEAAEQPVQQRLEKMWDDFLKTGRVPS